MIEVLAISNKRINVSMASNVRSSRGATGAAKTAAGGAGAGRLSSLGCFGV